ncbi:phage tail family protein [Aerococcus urinae]|uniref:distal tail protein Dit n=1 Tax=Aerococcus urinae TaxID=1376 RepID=UPI00254D0DD3|nr:distal tail protein Dit [Aerococcus urinae]MDK6688329.1 phage tail family protein [Aerococcus urinae]
MYTHTVLNGRGSTESAPTSNMSVNGTPLSDLIPGYRHLTVSGRGLVGRDVSTTDVPRRQGKWFNGADDKDQSLTIKYQLSAPSAAELWERTALLNKVLRQVNADGYLDITFNDEPKWHYKATLADVDSFEFNKLSIVSTYTLYCPSVFKKSPTKTGTTVRLKYANQVLADKITVNVPTVADKLVFSNGRNELVLSGSSYKDRVDIIYYEDHVAIDNVGRNLLTDLELFSTPETFYLRDKDLVTVTSFSGKKQIGKTFATVEWRDERQ